MTVSECAPCGRVFTSLAGFDQHQEYRFGTDTPVVCHDPVIRGLVWDGVTGRWHLPATDASRLRLTKMRAERGQS